MYGMSGRQGRRRLCFEASSPRATGGWGIAKTWCFQKYHRNGDSYKQPPCDTNESIKLRYQRMIARIEAGGSGAGYSARLTHMARKARGFKWLKGVNESKLVFKRTTPSAIQLALTTSRLCRRWRTSADWAGGRLCIHATLNGASTHLFYKPFTASERKRVTRLFLTSAKS